MLNLDSDTDPRRDERGVQTRLGAADFHRTAASSLAKDDDGLDRLARVHRMHRVVELVVCERLADLVDGEVALAVELNEKGDKLGRVRVAF